MIYLVVVFKVGEGKALDKVSQLVTRSQRNEGTGGEKSYFSETRSRHVENDKLYLEMIKSYFTFLSHSLLVLPSLVGLELLNM